MKRILFPQEARRLGIQWLPALGVRPRGQAGAEYFRVYGKLGTHPRSVRVRKAFNLGNHVRQVANAVRFAEVLGAETVELPRGSIFRTGSVGNVRVIGQSEEPAEGTIESTFFYYERMGLTFADLDRARILESLRALLPPTIPRGISGPGVALHLRAGDVFQANPHPRYGPPPLKFYLESLEMSGSDRVHVVTQSLDHPYLREIERWAQVRGVSIEVSASDLATDFEVMRSASRLCISQGTLALAAAWLSPTCQAVYTYEREDEENAVLRELGVRVHAASGRDFPKEWDGSSEQLRRLMSVDGRVEWSE